jgi:hypothetical protein
MFKADEAKHRYQLFPIDYFVHKYELAKAKEALYCMRLHCDDNGDGGNKTTEKGSGEYNINEPKTEKAKQERNQADLNDDDTCDGKTDELYVFRWMMRIGV